MAEGTLINHQRKGDPLPITSRAKKRKKKKRKVYNNVSTVSKTQQLVRLREDVVDRPVIKATVYLSRDLAAEGGEAENRYNVCAATFDPLLPARTWKGGDKRHTEHMPGQKACCTWTRGRSGCEGKDETMFLRRKVKQSHRSAVVKSQREHSGQKSIEGIRRSARRNAEQGEIKKKKGGEGQ